MQKDTCAVWKTSSCNCWNHSPAVAVLTNGTRVIKSCQVVYTTVGYVAKAFEDASHILFLPVDIFYYSESLYRQIKKDVLALGPILPTSLTPYLPLEMVIKKYLITLLTQNSNKYTIVRYLIIFI